MSLFIRSLGKLLYFTTQVKTMYSITQMETQFALVSLDGEVIITSSYINQLETFLASQEVVETLAPELEGFVHFDTGANCSCDPYGDIWINPEWVVSLQEETGIPLEVILQVIICHELGHAYLLEHELDASNEQAAWDIGEYLLRRIESPEAVLTLYKQFKDILLPTYKGDPKWSKWKKEKPKLVKEVIASLY